MAAVAPGTATCEEESEVSLEVSEDSVRGHLTPRLWARNSTSWRAADTALLTAARKQLGKGLRCHVPLEVPALGWWPRVATAQETEAKPPGKTACPAAHAHWPERTS